MSFPGVASLEAFGFSAGLRKGARIPSIADEVATERRIARRRFPGSRRYGLASMRVGLFT